MVPGGAGHLQAPVPFHFSKRQSRMAPRPHQTKSREAKPLTRPSSRLRQPNRARQSLFHERDLLPRHHETTRTFPAGRNYPLGAFNMTTCFGAQDSGASGQSRKGLRPTRLGVLGEVKRLRPRGAFILNAAAHGHPVHLTKRPVLSAQKRMRERRAKFGMR